MATTYIKYNRSTDWGANLRQLLNHGEAFLDQGPKLLDTVSRMIDGDGSQDAHYALVTTMFGFESDAKSHAAFNELNSAFAKLTTDGSVQFVNAALKQLFSEFR
jgi:hypothetical protein